MSFGQWTLFCLMALGSGYGLWIIMSHISPYRTYRIRKSLKCLAGFHEPGTPVNEWPNKRVQYCDWCGERCHEYDIEPPTKTDVEKIRRIY